MRSVGLSRLKARERAFTIWVEDFNFPFTDKLKNNLIEIRIASGSSVCKGMPHGVDRDRLFRRQAEQDFRHGIQKLRLHLLHVKFSEIEQGQAFGSPFAQIWRQIRDYVKLQV